MNGSTLKGQLKELTEKARKEWGKLTQDDWLQIEGDFERLSGAIQHRYGVARERAAGQIRAFMQGLEQDKPARKARSAPRRDRPAVTARERTAAGL